MTATSGKGQSSKASESASGGYCWITFPAYSRPSHTTVAVSCGPTTCAQVSTTPWRAKKPLPLLAPAIICTAVRRPASRIAWSNDPVAADAYSVISKIFHADFTHSLGHASACCAAIGETPSGSRPTWRPRQGQTYGRERGPDLSNNRGLISTIDGFLYMS